MNSLSRTEFRTLSDRQLQNRMNRALANRRAAERAREERFRKLRTPSQPEPVQMCAAVEDAEPLFTRAEVVIFALLAVAAIGIYIARSAGVL